jgi:hypothetical protein
VVLAEVFCVVGEVAQSGEEVGNHERYEGVEESAKQFERAANQFERVRVDTRSAIFHRAGSVAYHYTFNSCLCYVLLG